MHNNSLHPCSLWKAAGRDLAVAQGPRPGAAVANSLLDSVIIRPNFRAPASLQPNVKSI